VGHTGTWAIKPNQSDQSKNGRIWLTLRQAQDLATQRHEGTKGFHFGVMVFKVWSKGDMERPETGMRSEFKRIKAIKVKMAE
jgi:hypothetical protein